MKVVFDTNVLISSLLSNSGSPSQSFNLILDDRITMYYCQRMFVEYERVLSYPKFNFAAERIYVTLQKITSFGIKIESPTASTFKMDDPTDRIFYDTAKYCNAILITGNLKHYPRESFVMNPNDFLRRFNERENRRADFSR